MTAFSVRTLAGLREDCLAFMLRSWRGPVERGHRHMTGKEASEEAYMSPKTKDPLSVLEQERGEARESGGGQEFVILNIDRGLRSGSLARVMGVVNSQQQAEKLVENMRGRNIGKILIAQRVVLYERRIEHHLSHESLGTTASTPEE
jgi:hypothetical protein